MNYDKRKLGLLLRLLRQKRGLSQEVLSGFAGIARSHLSMVENGVKSPTVETLMRITEALDLPMSEFFRMLEETQGEDR